jgi:hypothetical protein
MEVCRRALTTMRALSVASECHHLTSRGAQLGINSGALSADESQLRTARAGEERKLASLAEGAAILSERPNGWIDLHGLTI